MRIEYYGILIEIPYGVIYLATDEDGRIYGYKEQPIQYKGFWQSTGSRIKWLGRTSDRPFADWQGSLVRIDEIPKPQRMKQVAYKGGILQVPYGATHIATDPQGTILAFEGHPSKSNNGWHGKGHILYSHRIKTDSIRQARYLSAEKQSSEP